MNLMLGDCLKRMNEIPDGSVDLVLCDLPYGTTACKWDSVIPFDALWVAYNRVIKKGGCVSLFGAEPFSSFLRLSNLNNYKYDWIWEKNTGTNFLHAKRMPIRYTENIHVFMNGTSKYNPQKTQGHIPTNSGIGSHKGSLYSGKNKFDYKGGNTDRYPKNIIKFNSVNNYARVHPTQKPTELLEYIIKSYTNEGETVLDNCMGSGTTGVACANTNRKFIGIEMDEGYFNIAKDRITDAVNALNKEKE